MHIPRKVDYLHVAATPAAFTNKAFAGGMQADQGTGRGNVSHHLLEGAEGALWGVYVGLQGNQAISR
jgi:hypothetical protein